jgi:hypothetical protein
LSRVKSFELDLNKRKLFLSGIDYVVFNAGRACIGLAKLQLGFDVPR